MDDVIEILKDLDKDPRDFHNVNYALNKIDYSDDNLKRIFFTGLLEKKFIDF